MFDGATLVIRSVAAAPLVHLLVARDEPCRRAAAMGLRPIFQETLCPVSGGSNCAAHCPWTRQAYPS